MPKSRRRPVATDKRFRKNQPNSDYGPRERWQHSGRTLEFTECAGVLAARATEEHVVDILVMRGLITARESEAAFRLKLDFQRAGLDPHVTGSYNPVRPKTDHVYGARERTESEEAAYRRWRHAVREMGLQFSDPVISVVCLDHAPLPRDVEALKRGLERLVKWYRLPQTDAEDTPPGR